MKKNVQELQLIINDFFNSNTIENNQYDIQELIINVQLIYEQFNKSFDESLCKKLIIERFPVLPPIYNKQVLDELKIKIDKLKLIKQPAQRSEEWYEFRNNRLTASDLATAINLNPYGNRKKLIANKCGYKEAFMMNGAITHGVKYEPVATDIYEKLNNVTVYEYGCVPHDKIDYFAASPDGICECDENNINYAGRMLEIKCPSKRALTGFVPEYYELQIQGQLEVCDLEYCDFLECVIKEYNSIDEYINDSLDDNLNRGKNKLRKGVIIEIYNNNTQSSEYIYKYHFNSKKEIEIWEETTLNNYLNSDVYDYNGTSYWYLQEYSIILVKRDIERFKEIKKGIDIFWSDVLKYREIGYETLVKTKEKKKYETKQLDFLPDSD